MAEILSIISIIFFVASGIFATMTIIMWFLFKIPVVIADLSGRSAKKSIEMMRKNNEKMKNKAHKYNVISIMEGKNVNRTEKMEKKDVGGNYETMLLNQNIAVGYGTPNTEILTDENNTVKLQDENETVPLDGEETKWERKASSVKIVLLEEIMYIHTEEVI